MAHKPNLKKNFLFSLSYQVLAIILPLITAPYISRTLGAENSGIFSKTQALAHYFLLFSVLGVANYGNRAIARVRDNKREMSRTFWEIYAFQFTTSVLCTLAYVLFCIFFESENKLIYIMQGLYCSTGLFDINWCCNGMEKFKLSAVRSAVVKIGSALCIFTFVKNPDDLWLYTLIIGLGYLLSHLAIWPFVLKHIEWVRPTWPGIKKHIRPNLVLFWPVVAVSIYNYMDKIMLGQMSTDAEVGFYSYAERLINVPTTLILALDNVVMPRMSHLHAKEGGSEHIQRLMDIVMMSAMFMSAAMAFGVAGVAEVFTPMFYGPGYARCGYFIMLLSPVIVFKGWAGALRTQFIIPTGRDRIYVISLTAGAVSNAVLNALLIPSLQGVGAIIGTLVAELLVALIQFTMCRKDIHLKKYMINGVSFCLIGLVMFIAVRALSHVSSSHIVTLIPQVLTGVVIYVTLAGLYMVKVLKDPVLVNEALKALHIKYRIGKDMQDA